jgi:hypothetical protein
MSSGTALPPLSRTMASATNIDVFLRNNSPIVNDERDEEDVGSLPFEASALVCEVCVAWALVHGILEIPMSRVGRLTGIGWRDGET